MSLFGGSTPGPPKDPAGPGGLFEGFRDPSKTSAPATGGLFASTTGTSAPASGGLFGKPLGSLGSTTTTSAAPSGGLFGGLGSSTTTSSAAPTGGLFGGSLGASTAKPAGSSMFGGGLGGGSTQPAGGSLFGNPTGSTAPAASSIFGQTGTSTATPFGGLGAGATGAQNSASQAPQTNPLAASTATAGGLAQSQQNGQQNHAYFDSLLEKSRKRMHGDTEGNELPHLQLGLGDLRQRIKRLGPGQQDRNVDGRAHYLLAASGVDPGAAVRDLAQFSTAAKTEQRSAFQQPADTDVESYLANLQTQTTLSMISDGLARSIRDFDTFLEENVSMEWDAQRKRIYEHFGIKSRQGGAIMDKGSFSASASESKAGGFGRSRRSKAQSLAASRAKDASTFGRSSMQKSAIGAAVPVGTAGQQVFADVTQKQEQNGVAVAVPTDRFQREKQNKYAQKVQNLNVARMQKRPYAICEEFASVVEQAGEQHSPDLVKAYKALAEVVAEVPDLESLSDPLAARERKFAKSYLDETNTPASLEVKKRTIRGGTKCLEKLAFEEVESTIAKNPREANLGGIPNVISKVRAYVRLLALKKRLCGDNSDLQSVDGGDYIWAVTYYLLRTGHIQEIGRYVNDNINAFRAFDRNFAAYISEYTQSDERRLGRINQDKINNEYNQRSRNAPKDSLDPYKMACYKIIGRCDLRARSIEGINHTVEDFVWLQLVLAREVNRVDEIASEVYGLSDLQKTMAEIGSRFFVKGGAEVGCSFGAFVFFQVACGMFEEAVSYLYSFTYTDAVHLATAMDFYGLLRVSDPMSAADDLLTRTTRGNPQINFGRMIGYYTRDFRAANVAAAVDYLVLICLNKDLGGEAGNNQIRLCHEALRELVLESREFALLLGDILNGGAEIKGLIAQRTGLIGISEEDDFMKDITMRAASTADDNGRITDAVLLFMLAREYDNVVVILLRALSEYLTVPIGQENYQLQPSKQGGKDLSIDELSLSSADNPVTLALQLRKVLGQDRAKYNKIKPINADAVNTMLSIAQAKELFDHGNLTEVLDKITEVDILPLNAKGNASLIRQYATKFSSLIQPIAATVPNLLMWSIYAINQMRDQFNNSQYTGNDDVRTGIVADMRVKSMDLTTYTSQLRYRFPADLHEALARAQSE
ncbi:Nup93/Nic96-domain-containing protein [Halenospora varia]|nr:Nup93/Nic96-domain-containing protein [Halenospora varia]